MRHGKSNIPKRRPKAREKEVRITLRKKTAENIMQLNMAVTQKMAELAEAQARLQNHCLPLLTERGIMDGRVIEVTEKEPFELVLMVPK